MIYPTYYKKELCCGQVVYIKQLSETKGVYVKTVKVKDKVEVKEHTTVTCPNGAEFEAHFLRDFIEVPETEFPVSSE